MERRKEAFAHDDNPLMGENILQSVCPSMSGICAAATRPRCGKQRLVSRCDVSVRARGAMSARRQAADRLMEEMRPRSSSSRSERRAPRSAQLLGCPRTSRILSEKRHLLELFSLARSLMGVQQDAMNDPRVRSCFA